MPDLDIKRKNNVAIDFILKDEEFPPLPVTKGWGNFFLKGGAPPAKNSWVSSKDRGNPPAKKELSDEEELEKVFLIYILQNWSNSEINSHWAKIIKK